MIECFKLKRIVTVGDVMALTVGSSQHVKEGVQQPMKDKQHLYLLPEMNLLMSHKLRLIVWLARDPNEDEKR